MNTFSFAFICFHLSFRGICASDSVIKAKISELFRPLALAYEKVYELQKGCERLAKARKEEFFGLRDYYRYHFKLCLQVFISQTCMIQQISEDFFIVISGFMIHFRFFLFSCWKHIS